jgi:hypothetical protein
MQDVLIKIGASGIGGVGRDYGGNGGDGKAIIAFNCAANSDPTLNFTADPIAIDPGGSSSLIWSTTNVTSCWAESASPDWNGWINPVSAGSRPESPATTTDYYLECWNDAVTPAVSTGKKKVTITVNPPPCIKNCNNDSSTCAGVVYSDGCGGSCTGSKIKNDCEKDTCIGSTCTNCPGGGVVNDNVPGTKDCRDQNWQEVSPN